MNKLLDTLVVDGYNVINAWPELVMLKDKLEQARDKLIEIMASYGAFQGYKVIVVFDAHFVPGMETFQLVAQNLSVVYTSESETADSCIEKMVYALVPQGEQVYVVTSDWAEQLIVLGAGACRISARELLRDVKRVNKAIQAGFTENVETYRRSELENRLNSDVVKLLNEIRFGRK